MANGIDPTYDAYERDIAVVTFFFEKEGSVFEYIREARMTPVAFMSQVGGLMGLCLGFSFLSLVELVYWVTFRMARNVQGSVQI